MKRLSNIPVGVLAVGIAGMLCAVSARAQTPQFIQVSPLYFTMPVGSNPLPQTVNAVSTGYSFFFTATAQTTSGGAWLQANCAAYATPAACSISVNAATLSAGTYAGQAVLNGNGNGSAMTVPVTLTVVGSGVPFFGGVAGGLSFVSGSGFSPAAQRVQLTNAGTGALNWTAAASTSKTSTGGSVNWLSVSATNGTAPSVVTVSVSPQGLPAGVYLGQALFQAASSSFTVPVSLVVVDANTTTFEQAPGVNFTMPVGSNPLPQTITAVSTGYSFFFKATAQTASGGAWLQVNCAAYATPAACSISVNAATLSAGTYAGQVVLNVNGSGSAMTVPVTLTVVGSGVPFFGGVAGGLSFVSGSGFSPAPQNVQLTNAGTGVLSWTAAASIYRTTTVVVAGQFTDVNWLSVSATNGTAPSVVTVSVSPQGLPAGVYLGQVLFQAASSSFTVPVSLVVVDANTSAFEQAPGVNFTMPVGSNPLPQTVTAISTGYSFFLTATAQTASGGSWLQVNCGASATPAACSISVKATTLSAGIYAGQVVLNVNGNGSAMTVPVTLTVVGSGVPFFGGVAGGLSFVSGSGFSPAPQDVQLTNAGTGALNWTAAVSIYRTTTVVIAGQFTDVNWLSVSGTSGIAPSIVTVSVSPQDLTPGIYLGQVLFQAASSSFTVPVSLVVVDSNPSKAINTFQQVPGVTFTTPVGSNPLAQTVTAVSTGYSFFLTATAQTASGGSWLQVNCGVSATPAACSISVKATTLSAGIYAGQVVFSNGGTAMTVPVTLTVGNPGSASTITQVLNATGEAATISQNTWVEIKGANLAQVTQDWSSQTSFAQGLLPTSVAGVSATVNNKPAFIFYVSPTQVNILTPLDTATGAITVKLTTALNSGTTTITAGATMVPNSLGIFTANFTGNLYPSAYHAVSTCSTTFNGVCLLGPPSLYPGLSTPAVPGETIVLYGNGFGLVNPPLVNGIAFPPLTPLPTLPSITIGGLPAKVAFAAIVSAGLYQFNVEVPTAAPDGDNLLVITYNGVTTQANVFITVKK